MFICVCVYVYMCVCVLVKKKQTIMTNLKIMRILQQGEDKKIVAKDIEHDLNTNELTFFSIARSGHSLLHALATRPDLCTPSVLKHVEKAADGDLNVEERFPQTNLFIGHTSYYLKPLNLAVMDTNLPLLNTLLALGANPFVGVDQGLMLISFAPPSHSRCVIFVGSFLHGTQVRLFHLAVPSCAPPRPT